MLFTLYFSGVWHLHEFRKLYFPRRRPYNFKSVSGYIYFFSGRTYTGPPYVLQNCMECTTPGRTMPLGGSAARAAAALPYRLCISACVSNSARL